MIPVRILAYIEQTAIAVKLIEKLPDFPQQAAAGNAARQDTLHYLALALLNRDSTSAEEVALHNRARALHGLPPLHPLAAQQESSRVHAAVLDSESAIIRGPGFGGNFAAPGDVSHFHE